MRLLLSLALTSFLHGQTAQELMDRGMENFVKGNIAQSVKDFDAAAKLNPEAEPHLWQRGISYYYLGRFEDGRKQFEVHRTVNPNDVENAAWWYLCMARLGRRDEAREKLLPVGDDERVPMAEIYALYAGRGSEKQVLAAIERDDPTGRDLKIREFYGHLYLGLYAEAEKNPVKMREHIRKAVGTDLGGYMWEVARIHLERLSAKK